ncbi:MAG: hypothetical protein ACPL5F_14545 [Moorellaceae bacterium]
MKRYDKGGDVFRGNTGPLGQKFYQEIGEEERIFYKKEEADYWLRLHPGTDIPLLNGLMYIIVKGYQPGLVAPKNPKTPGSRTLGENLVAQAGKKCLVQK